MPSPIAYGEARPGRTSCECIPPPGVHPGDECPNLAPMWDGMFVCNRGCRTHTLVNFTTETREHYEARTGRRWEDRP